MERFQGRLRDGDLTIFARVTGYVESQEGRSTASGCFEIHEGGILGDGLPGGRTYRLELDDGRGWLIRPTKVHASDSAGIARVEFGLAGVFDVGSEIPVVSVG